MDTLKPGRIFWKEYPGSRGDGKRRPMVVTTRVGDIRRTGRVTAIVCSTDFDPFEPSDKDICLPSHPTGKVVTRLKRQTVAVCDWTVEFPVNEIDETGGMVPAAILKEICIAAGIIYVPER